MSRRTEHLIRIAILTAVYVATGRLGLLLNSVSGFATLVWAPTGVSLAALLLYGSRMWPGVALGALVVNVWMGAPLPIAAGIAVGNTFEALVAVWLLRRVAHFHTSLDRVRDVVALAGLACASATIAATIGVTTLWLGDRVSEGFVQTWFAWLWGDLAGALLVAPLLLVGRTTDVIGRRSRIEVAALAGCLVLACALIFYPPASPELAALARPFLLFPLLTWAGFRFGPRGAASTNFVVCAIAITATVHGLGPYARPALHDGLLALQSFMAISAVTTLILGAIVVERSQAAALAREAALHANALIDGAPDAVVTIDRRGTIREFNPAAEQLFGFQRRAVVGKDVAPLLVPPALRDTFRRVLATLLRSGNDRLLRTRVRHPALRADGTEFSAEIAVTSVAIGGLPMFTGFIHDVTAEQVAEQELQRSHDELERRVHERTTALRQANLGLMQREGQLREAQSLAILGSFEWDIEHDRLTGSDELYRIHGLELGSALSVEALLARTHPGDRAWVRSIVETSRAEPQPFSFEDRIVHPDGSIRLLRYASKVEFDASGKAVRMLGTCQDITAQRQAEEARFRLAAIVESSDDAIIGKTVDGVVQSWNRGAEQIYGYSAREAIGHSIATLVIPAEHQPELQRLFERVRNGDRLTPFETVGRRKDGTLFDASVRMSPILDAAGQSIGIATITRDITEYKRAMAKFRRFIEAAPDAMIVVDRSGAIVLANARTEQLFGYRDVELVGNQVERLVPKYLAEPRPMGSQLELSGVRKDGTGFPIEMTLAPIETEEGMLESASIRDITDRIAIESKLTSSLEEKEILLREIHHRVKNNLQVIASLLHLQAVVVASEEAVHSLEESQSRIQSMALVHQLLCQSEDLTRIDFEEYLNSLIARLLRSYGVEGNAIEVSVTAPSLRLDIDMAVPTGLIVNELVSNSILHAFPEPCRGKISVTLTRDDDGYFVMSVKDDGVGISDTARLESARTLGLQIVRALTRQLHGNVEVVRDGGTTVCVTFPAQKGTAAPSDWSLAGVPSSASDGGVPGQA